MDNIKILIGKTRLVNMYVVFNDVQVATFCQFLAKKTFDIMKRFYLKLR